MVIPNVVQTGLGPAEKRATPQSSTRRPALLAICSDLDETPDADTYFELSRFLNTREETRMGSGVGLEVGNTLYFDMPPGHFSYWSASEANREKIRALIRSGHIDCLHSYGDLATTRGHAGRALEELSKHGCQVKVWIDHAQAITNFGADIMRGQGDVPGHPAYHADLTLQYGIKYMWRGRVTSVIGQNRRFSLRGIGTTRHPLASTKTLAKEAAKQLLARAGNRKFWLHRDNRLLAQGVLRDDRSLPEFIRCNPCWGGVSSHDRGDGIHEVLTRRYLNRLSERGGVSIVYAHLGKLDRGGGPKNAFPAATVAAFRLLAEYQQAGRIRVTTTARLLDLQSSGGDIAAVLAQWRPLEFPAI